MTSVDISQIASECFPLCWKYFAFKTLKSTWTFFFVKMNPYFPTYFASVRLYEWNCFTFTFRLHSSKIWGWLFLPLWCQTQDWVCRKERFLVILIQQQGTRAFYMTKPNKKIILKSLDDDSHCVDVFILVSSLYLFGGSQPRTGIWHCSSPVSGTRPDYNIIPTI